MPRVGVRGPVALSAQPAVHGHPTRPQPSGACNNKYSLIGRIIAKFYGDPADPRRDACIGGAHTRPRMRLAEEWQPAGQRAPGCCR